MSTTIKLQDLDIEQLASFKKDTEAELQNLSFSLQALTTAVAKFKSNIENIKEVSKKPKDNDILIPLTSSLYAPGRIVNNDKFLCDVGTGYFIEKNSEDAITFYEKKITKLTSDSGSLNDIIKNKNDMLRSIEAVLQRKVIETREQIAKK